MNIDRSEGHWLEHSTWEKIHLQAPKLACCYTYYLQKYCCTLSVPYVDKHVWPLYSCTLCCVLTHYVVYLPTMLCTYTVCCVLTQCVVYLHSVLCTYTVCCVLTQCVVYLHSVLCTYTVCCVLTHYVVYLHTMLCTYTLCCVLTHYVVYLHSVLWMPSDSSLTLSSSRSMFSTNWAINWPSSYNQPQTGQESTQCQTVFKVNNNSHLDKIHDFKATSDASTHGRVQW